MKITNVIAPGKRIRAFYLFFIICTVQLGVGIMGAPSYIFGYARQDAWISILIAGLALILILSVIIYILSQYENSDIFGIQVDIFGSFIGKVLGSIYIIYLAMALLSVMLTYIEVVQVFIRPTMPSYVIGGLILILVIYCIWGGVKVIVGVAFLFFVLSQWLLILLYDPILRMDWSHLLPVLDASFIELLKGAKASSYTLLGFEILFIIYPYIDNKKEIKLPVFLAIIYSVLTLLITTIISIGYYSLENLRDSEWTVITLFKSASFSFAERLDYIVVMEWMMIVVPNNIFLAWATTYGIKRLYNIQQRKSLYILCILLLVSISILKYDYLILQFTTIVSNMGFWINCVYPFILATLVFLKKKRSKHKGMNTT